VADAAVTVIVCTSTGFDECWECGGSATLGKTQDAITHPSHSGRYCGYDCLESNRDRAAREQRARDRRCNVCDEPEGQCCAEYPDVYQASRVSDRRVYFIPGDMVPWPHEYEPRVPDA
jgi:hypothetical protein